MGTKIRTDFVMRPRSCSMRGAQYKCLSYSYSIVHASQCVYVHVLQFCEMLVDKFNFHHYDSVKQRSHKTDPRLRHSEVQARQVVSLLFAAYNGDLTALRRMSSANQDMSVANYDGRTALHLAASEGHLECVRFLVETCGVPLAPRDRWNRTPADDASRFHRDDVLQFLGECAGNPTNGDLRSDTVCGS